MNKSLTSPITKRRIERLLMRRKITKLGCWEYQGSRDKDGYGIFGNGKFQRAHRAAYILFVGNIKENLFVLHKCDNPSCFNPDHLYLGDAKQNAKDAKERGLIPTGSNPKKSLPKEKNGNVKLTQEQVDKIRELYGKPYGLFKLGKMFNISKRQIGRIIKGESWKIN